MSDEPIRFQRPQFPSSGEIERHFAASRDARWFSNSGPCHGLLSDGLERYLSDGCTAALMSSATTGLMLALRALVPARPPGRLVIAPSFTFPATAEAIAWNGLEPLWVDIERDGWHLDPEQLAGALQAHRGAVAAVLACSTFGTAPPREQSDAWRDLCRRHGVPLIVDSAAGFGSRDENGDYLGGQGDAEVFSFHATKPFAIGEGGAVSSADGDLAERLRSLANFGFARDREIDPAVGMNAKMSELHCAVGLAVLSGFDSVLQARRDRAERLRPGLEAAGFTFQAGAGGSAWQFVPVLAPSRAVGERVLERSHNRMIEIRRYHHPLHLVPAFSMHRARGTLPVTEDLAGRSLSLPMANDLSEQAIERILDLMTGASASAAAEGAVLR